MNSVRGICYFLRAGAQIYFPERNRNGRNFKRQKTNNKKLRGRQRTFRAEKHEDEVPVREKIDRKQFAHGREELIREDRND